MSSDDHARRPTGRPWRGRSSARWLALLAVSILGIHYLAPTAFGQTARIASAELLPTGPHRIGDRLRVRVRLTAPEGVTPEVATAGEPPDDVVWGTAKLAKQDGAATDGMAVWQLVWPVQVFRVGPYELPPIEIGVGTTVVLTEPFAVDTVSVRSGPDADILRDTLPPVPVYRTNWTPAIIAGAGVLLLAGYAVYRRRPRVEAAPQPETPREPDALEWAEAEFARLERVAAPDEESLRQFIDDVSDVVRGYIQRRVGVAAPRLTTLETLVALRGALTDELRHPLRQTLNGADYVKFAKQIPARSAGREFLDHARETCRACERAWVAPARVQATAQSA